MVCDSPQLLLAVGSDKAVQVPCGLCLSCCKAKDDVDRARKLYWLKRKRGSHV